MHPNNKWQHHSQGKILQNLRSFQYQDTKPSCRTFSQARVPWLGKSKPVTCAGLNTIQPTINTAIAKQPIFIQEWKNIKAATMTHNNLETEDKNRGTTETATTKRGSVQGVNQNRLHFLWIGRSRYCREAQREQQSLYKAKNKLKK